MRKVEFEQGSQEWLAWRRGLITATEASVLMGASPYATPYMGWKRKTGQVPEQQETEAMRRGKRDEPIAREWFIKEYDIDMEPCCVESDNYKFIGASLDGISKCGRYILEIKSNGDQYHFGLNGGLPDFHQMQMQHQFLATDLIPEKGFYLSWHKSGPIVKEVDIDRRWLEKYIPKAKEYWRCVALLEAPPLTIKDYRERGDLDSWVSLSEEYKAICIEEENRNERKLKVKEALVLLSENENSRGNGLSVFKRSMKGRIDYDKVEELKSIDLEKYRKETTSSWVVTLN